MLEFRQRQKRRRLLSSNLTILALLLVVGIVAKETWDIYTKERHARELLESAQMREKDLSEREAFLESEITLLNNEEGVEGKLRERFGIARPGEKVIMLIDAEATTAPPETDRGWWATLRSWFE